MKNEFICPHCKGHLVVNNSLVLSIRSEWKKVGLVFLSPELGDYTLKMNPNLGLKDGEKVTVFCPICHADLKAKGVHDDLARLLMIDEKGEECEILFSGIFGEHSTYKIAESKVESYGTKAGKYIDFFNLSNMK